MIVMLEGMDRCGKDTQARMIIEAFSGCTFHQLHYSKAPQLTPESSMSYADMLYCQMFLMISRALDANESLILNRAHLGEHVYGHYRGYDGSYIFDVEDEYAYLMSDICLFVLVDEPEHVLSREDGDSLGSTIEAKQDEKLKFEQAYDRSSIEHKVLINIAGKSIETVAEIIHNKLTQFITRHYDDIS